MNFFKFIIFPLLAAILFSANHSFADEYQKSTMSVDGKGEVVVKPDMAILGISVETIAKNAKEAVSENSAKTNEVISTLKKKLGPDDTLKSSEYTLSPVYEYDQAKKRSFITSYRVTNEVTVKTFRIEKLGEIIDATTDVGANKVNGPAFDSSKREESKRAALTKAVEDAKKTARSLADAANIKIVKILRITPSYNYPMPVYKQTYRTAMATESSDPPDIESGDLSIEANVNIIYEIQQ